MLVYGSDKELCDWASTLIFRIPEQFQNSKAIGVSNNGKIIAAVIYSNYYLKPDGTGLSIEMSIASIDKRWATRHNLKAFFSYPFIQLGLERVWTQCSLNDGEIMQFNKRLGFIQEGIHRKAWPLGGDSASFGMIKDGCKWL